ncbi:MAG: zinc dependent phospholipase C family protein [Clostridia bacterium]|nr:zinc dependent phospholipase C family protein [Clostridia bacterium]
MRTKDHKQLALIYAERMNGVPALYKRAFIFGNTEPDRNFLTYLHGIKHGSICGHNYKNVLKTFYRLLNKCKEQPECLLDYYRLGKIFHYVADIFTYAHNENFKGGLIDHKHYEANLHNYIAEYLKNNVDGAEETKPLSQIKTGLLLLHDEYMQQTGGIENDCKFITSATAMLYGTYFANVTVKENIYESVDNLGFLPVRN